jgi:hypothetical protein
MRPFQASFLPAMAVAARRHQAGNIQHEKSIRGAEMVQEFVAVFIVLKSRQQLYP